MPQQYQNIGLTDPTSLQNNPAFSTAAMSGAPNDPSLTQLSDMPGSSYQANLGANPAFSTTSLSTQPSSGFSWPGFLGSPVVQAGVPGLIGLYGAGQQQRLGNQVAGTIPGAALPATQLGAGISRQLQGGAPVPGPYGASIGQQTGAAAQLGNVAQEYASGNLTPAQQLALQQGVNAATASKNLAFAMSGNPLSSASIAEGQNINNQAIIASQQIQQNNIQLAQSALQTIQNTYGNLVSQVLSSAGLGAESANAAARLIMANNAQVQQQLTSIWQNIAKGILGAAAPPQQPGGGTPPQSSWTQLWGKILGQNQPGAVNPQPGQTPQAPDQFQQGPMGQQVLSNMENLPQFNAPGLFGPDTTASTDTSGGGGDSSTPTGGP
jgi:hypothetical protein